MRAVIVCLLAACLGLVAQARPPGRAAWNPATFLVYYGHWTDARIEQGWDFSLVILRGDAIEPEQVTRLRLGRDGKPGTADDVRVLAYLSLGEEYPSYPGPVVVQEMLRALDARSARLLCSGFNATWGTRHVRVSNPRWVERVHRQSADMLTRLGCDGLFLDTLDVASRWGPYPWMEKDMVRLVSEVRAWHPQAYLVANRGVSLFFEHSAEMRASLDGLLFESFMIDWDWSRQRAVLHPNLDSHLELLRRVLLPQARRPDGFCLLFLNYAAGDQRERVMRREARLLRNVPGARYWSTPGLDQWFPAIEKPDLTS